MLVDVNAPSGTVLRILCDESGKVLETSGVMKGYAMELQERFPNLTVEQLVSRFNYPNVIVDEEATEMNPVTSDDYDDKESDMPPPRKKKVTKSDQLGEFNEVAKFDVDKQLVFGWAYVTHDMNGNVVVDKSGEFIDDYSELEDAAYLFVQKSRVGGDSHHRDLTGEELTDSPRQVGTMIESVVFTPEKVAKMGIPPGVLPTGWWVGFKVEDPEVWKAVKEGRRPAFSIHGKGKREEVI